MERDEAPKFSCLGGNEQFLLKATQLVYVSISNSPHSYLKTSNAPFSVMPPGPSLYSLCKGGADTAAYYSPMESPKMFHSSAKA